MTHAWHDHQRAASHNRLYIRPKTLNCRGLRMRLRSPRWGILAKQIDVWWPPLDRRSNLNGACEADSPIPSVLWRAGAAFACLSEGPYGWS